MSALLDGIIDANAKDSEPSSVEETSISLDSVHKMTTYDLRQELERRKCMDIPEEEINHNSMLKRLIAELVKEDAAKTNNHTQAVVDKAAAERQAAKLLREQRKAEAVERSKARQAANSNYFKAKQDINSEAESNKAITFPTDDASRTDEHDGETVEETVEETDPFRSYKSNRRAKIAGFS